MATLERSADAGVARRPAQCPGSRPGAGWQSRTGASTGSQSGQVAAALLPGSAASGRDAGGRGPKAAAPARNPASTSSPLGVSPGPLPSRRVATAVAALWSPAAATWPRASRAGAHSRTARTTTGPSGPAQRTSPLPINIRHERAGASEVSGNSALVDGSTRPHGSRTASWLNTTSTPGGPAVFRYSAPRVTPRHSACRAGAARTVRKALLAAARNGTSRIMKQKTISVTPSAAYRLAMDVTAGLRAS